MEFDLRTVLPIFAVIGVVLWRITRSDAENAKEDLRHSEGDFAGLEDLPLRKSDSYQAPSKADTSSETNSVDANADCENAKPTDNSSECPPSNSPE